jgi:hypothetical protein
MGVAVLVASCSTTMKFLYSFSMSAGSFSLVASFVLISYYFSKEFPFCFGVMENGLEFP